MNKKITYNNVNFIITNRNTVITKCGYYYAEFNLAEEYFQSKNKLDYCITYAKRLKDIL